MILIPQAIPFRLLSRLCGEPSLLMCSSNFIVPVILGPCRARAAVAPEPACALRRRRPLVPPTTYYIVPKNLLHAHRNSGVRRGGAVMDIRILVMLLHPGMLTTISQTRSKAQSRAQRWASPSKSSKRISILPSYPRYPSFSAT